MGLLPRCESWRCSPATGDWMPPGSAALWRPDRHAKCRFCHRRGVGFLLRRLNCYASGAEKSDLSGAPSGATADAFAATDIVGAAGYRPRECGICGSWALTWERGERARWLSTLRER